MSDDWKQFLLEKPRTAKLATTASDGAPHVTPVWVGLEGETIVFNTGDTTAKALHMKRDARVCLCLDDEKPPFSFLIVHGTAELHENDPDLLKWTTEIAGRYMGAEQAEKYGKRNGVPGELVVKVQPTKVIFKRNVAK